MYVLTNVPQRHEWVLTILVKHQNKKFCVFVKTGSFHSAASFLAGLLHFAAEIDSSLASCTV